MQTLLIVYSADLKLYSFDDDILNVENISENSDMNYGPCMEGS